MFGISLPSTDPSEVVKQVANTLKEAADNAGISNADAFIDNLEGLKEKAQEGPNVMLDAISGAVEALKKTIEDAMEDPSSLVPGPLAACATWYGNAVVAKLKAFVEEVQKIFEAIKGMATSLTEPFQEVSKFMGEAMAALTKTIKGLTKLPADVQSLADQVKGPEDLKNVDTETMKASLDLSAMDDALGGLGGLKPKFAPLIELVGKFISHLVEFLETGADKVEAAFAVPSPCCCMTSTVMSNKPKAMTSMLDSLNGLRDIDFKPMTEMVKNMAETLGNLDVDAVKAPLSQFAESAKESVDALDTAVKGAKLAGGFGF